MRLLSLCLLCACITLPCPALNRTRADDEVVADTTALEMAAALRQVTGPVALVWEDGTATMVEVGLEPVLGTGTLAQRRDCVDTCITNYALSLECPPDGLNLELRLTVRTADGRLDEVFFGTVTGRGPGEVEWSTYAELPVDELVGTLDPSSVDAHGGVEGDASVIVWLDGVDDTLLRASVGIRDELPDVSRVGGLGETPRPEGEPS